MNAHDRLVAGIRCLQVLEKLSDYVDGELDPTAKATIDAHLEGCDWCERFGGVFSRVVTGLRQDLAADESSADDARADRIVAKVSRVKDR